MFTEEIEQLSFVVTRPALLGAVLFGPLAAALLCYIWAFCVQSHKLAAFRGFLVLTLKRRSKDLQGAQNTYYAAFTLLLFDGLTLIWGLVWGVLFFLGDKGLVFLIFAYIWLAFRVLSVCQHLIAALISVVFVCRPKWGGGLYSLSKGLNALPFIFTLMTFKIHKGILIGVDVYNFLLVVGIIVSCCALPLDSPTAEQRKPLVLMAFTMYLLVALPNAVMVCMFVVSNDHLPLALDVLLFTNFYVVLDALLFYLILKIDVEARSESQYECAIRA